MAVWPAGQVLAQAAAGYALEAKKEKKSITALELGGGPRCLNRQSRGFKGKEFLVEVKGSRGRSF